MAALSIRRDSRRHTSDEKLELLIDSIRDQAIFMLKPDGAIASWNIGAERIKGYPADEVLGKHFSLFYTPEDVEAGKPARDLQSAAAQGRCELEGWRIRKDGSRFWANVVITAVTDGAGRIRGFSKVTRDITERKKLQEERERLFEATNRQRQLFETVIEHAPAGIAVIDGNTLRVKWANPEYRVRLEEPFRSMDLKGLRIQDYLPRAEESGLADLFRKVARSGEPFFESEYEFVGFSNGIRYFRCSFIPLNTGDSGGRDIMVVLGDITQQVAARKRIEELVSQLEDKSQSLSDLNEELEKRNQEVEKANRLKSEFLASVSHEFRTPLHSISGFADLLTEQIAGELSPKQEHYVERIKHSAAHLLSLINDILDLSKIEAGRLDFHPENFQINEALCEVLETVGPLADAKRIQISNTPDPGVTVVADRFRFKQILLNLLSNAVKFTPDEGRITVSSAVVNNSVEISVADTGIGIAAEQQQALFDEFRQVSPSSRVVKEGTGLGLAITRRLVERQGGKIWVESEPGKGSCFTFRLPSDAVRTT